jgi:C-terminal processing protease CtpA/Prc
VNDNNNIFISTVFKGGMSDNAEIKSRDVIKAIEGFEESISIISKNI